MSLRKRGKSIVRRSERANRLVFRHETTDCQPAPAFATMRVFSLAGLELWTPRVRVELSSHVRIASRKPEFGAKDPDRQGSAQRIEHARRAGAGAAVAARSRRQLSGRQGLHGPRDR